MSKSDITQKELWKGVNESVFEQTDRLDREAADPDINLC